MNICISICMLPLTVTYFYLTFYVRVIVAMLPVFIQQQPYVLKKPLLLGYNKQGEGHIETTCLGQIVVTVIFRPVLSVAKSGKIQ